MYSTISLLIAYISSVFPCLYFSGSSDSVSFEVFQLVKLFVKNPRKSPCIYNLLSQGRNDILLRLSSLTRAISADSIDESFYKDREIVVETLMRSM